jgi:hypothetical protein
MWIKQVPTPFLPHTHPRRIPPNSVSNLQFWPSSRRSLKNNRLFHSLFHPSNLCLSSQASPPLPSPWDPTTRARLSAAAGSSAGDTTGSGSWASAAGLVRQGRRMWRVIDPLLVSVCLTSTFSPLFYWYALAVQGSFSISSYPFPYHTHLITCAVYSR